jgi:hypothetical protein
MNTTRKRFVDYLVSCGADLAAANRIFDSFAGDKGVGITNMIVEAKLDNWGEALTQHAGGGSSAE